MKSSPHFVGEHGIVQVNLGQAGNCSQNDILNARLRGRGNGDRISIATQTSRDPQNVKFSNGGFFLSNSTVRSCLCSHDLDLLFGC